MGWIECHGGDHARQSSYFFRELSIMNPFFGISYSHHVVWECLVDKKNRPCNGGNHTSSWSIHFYRHGPFVVFHARSAGTIARNRATPSTSVSRQSSSCMTTSRRKDPTVRLALHRCSLGMQIVNFNVRSVSNLRMVADRQAPIQTANRLPPVPSSCQIQIRKILKLRPLQWLSFTQL